MTRSSKIIFTQARSTRRTDGTWASTWTVRRAPSWRRSCTPSSSGTSASKTWPPSTPPATSARALLLLAGPHVGPSCFCSLGSFEAAGRLTGCHAGVQTLRRLVPLACSSARSRRIYSTTCVHVSGFTCVLPASLFFAHAPAFMRVGSGWSTLAWAGASSRTRTACRTPWCSTTTTWASTRSPSPSTSPSPPRPSSHSAQPLKP